MAGATCGLEGCDWVRTDELELWPGSRGSDGQRAMVPFEVDVCARCGERRLVRLGTRDRQIAPWVELGGNHARYRKKGRPVPGMGGKARRDRDEGEIARALPPARKMADGERGAGMGKRRAKSRAGRRWGIIEVNRFELRFSKMNGEMVAEVPGETLGEMVGRNSPGVARRVTSSVGVVVVRR